MMLEPITVEVTVNVSRDEAFEAFVTNIGDWWPMATHSMSKGIVGLEQKLGGLIIETSAGGEEFVWGHITAWNRPRHIELAWYVGATAETATQIAIDFEAIDDTQTMVTLAHAGWEALGDKAADTRSQYDSGWRSILLNTYAPFAQNQLVETKN